MIHCLLRRPRLFPRAAAALISAIVLVPASVANAGTQAEVNRLTAVQLFDLADQARAEGRMEDAAGLYDALQQDPDAEIRAEARFRKGMMFADAGRFSDAASSFRALLDEKPEAVRARLELARMHAAMGDEAAARREVRQAQATGLPPEVTETVMQFARAIRSPKRLGGSLGLALAPDTNVNRATQARTVDTIIAPFILTRDARARSGLGFKASGDAFAKLPLTETLSLVPKVSSSATLYRSRAFNDISGSTLLGLEWQRGKDRLNPSLGRTWRWYGGEIYARSATASIDWLRILGPRMQIVANASASRVRYSRNALQSGTIYDLNAAAERALDARTGASLTLSATRQTARDPGYATAAGGASILLWREMGATTLFASGGVRRTEGDARLLLFPERRQEWLLSGRVGATLRRFALGGFAPVVRVIYEKNISTVGIYDYRRLATELGIARAF